MDVGAAAGSYAVDILPSIYLAVKNHSTPGNSRQVW